MMDDNNNMKMPSPMDWKALRDYGLEHIRRTGSRHWTDLGVSDPGVTFLEAMTLSVNDLAYRSSAGMNDLLTRKGGKQVSLEGTMFPAEVILPGSPTTAEDWRKIMLENIPGIRNIRFEQVRRTVETPFIPKKMDAGTVEVSGYWHISAELGTNDGQEQEKDRYRRSIRNLFLRHRNLCEDILDITFTEQIQVGLCAEIEICPNIDMRTLLQEIYERMYDYVNPTIQFHTVEELLATGCQAGDIFSIRTPELGFIDRRELSEFNRKTDLYVSDVIALLMRIDGIRSVHHVHFLTEDLPSRKTVKGWQQGQHLSIPEDGNLTFTMTGDFRRYEQFDSSVFENNVIFTMNGLSFLPPEGDDGIRVQVKTDGRKPLKEGFRTTMPVPEGEYRSTDRYFSFQNLLPATYRMGIDTLPESASSLRKAERMQLKAYLTFFDQTLSDFLAQLDRLQDILSVKNDGDQVVNDTYWHGRLTDTDIVDVSKVLQGYPDYNIPSEDSSGELNRKNEILDHLLTRFAESFAEYTALEFIRHRTVSEVTLTETVEDKKRFLSDYPRISSLRSCGIDLTSEESVSGVERRIMRRLGINDPDSRGHLAASDEMGLYVLEHSLLVPEKSEDGFLQLARKEGEVKLIRDPYSFRVTVILPGWTDLSVSLNYRKYAERIIREEIPAHIFVKICWLSKDVMADFESVWSVWHSVMREGTTQSPGEDWERRRSEANAAVVDAFSRFANIYPEAVLMSDSVHDYDDGSGISRLDRTYLGSEEL